MFKKTLVILMACLLLMSTVPAMAETTTTLNVVTTIFPQFDFVRAIAGDTSNVNLHMLLKPGAESHSYEPTPQDIIAIRSADLFIYVGGESDEWVEGILESMPDSNVVPLKLTDMVTTVDEELVEGMQPESEQEDAAEEHEHELDEHVWTSPVNAIAMINAIYDAMAAKDAANAPAYRVNADTYIAKLQDLDTAFRDIVQSATRTELIFGDRFPMRYFTKEYGLTYYAAFPGCSTDTEPSAQTIAFLIDRVKEDKVPLVLYPELSTHRVADAISAETGVPTHVFYACHNLTVDEFNAGKTYVDFMTDNIATLKEALG